MLTPFLLTPVLFKTVEFLSLVFLLGYLNMATFRGAPAPDFPTESDENNVELEFIDKDHLPLDCIHSGDHFLEHPESEEEPGSDFFSKSSGSESEEELVSDKGEDLEVEGSTWSEQLTTTADIDFNQATGMAGYVDIRSLKSSKDFFELFFTDQVW